MRQGKVSNAFLAVFPMVLPDPGRVGTGSSIANSVIPIIASTIVQAYGKATVGGMPYLNASR